MIGCRDVRSSERVSDSRNTFTEKRLNTVVDYNGQPFLVLPFPFSGSVGGAGGLPGHQIESVTTFLFSPASPVLKISRDDR